MKPVNEKMRFVEQLEEIKARLKVGELTYDQAQELAAPLLADMNDRMREICREYGKKHKDLTFASFMR